MNSFEVLAQYMPFWYALALTVLLRFLFLFFFWWGLFFLLYLACYRIYMKIYPRRRDYGRPWYPSFVDDGVILHHFYDRNPQVEDFVRLRAVRFIDGNPRRGYFQWIPEDPTWTTITFGGWYVFETPT